MISARPFCGARANDKDRVGATRETAALFRMTARVNEAFRHRRVGLGPSRRLAQRTSNMSAPQMHLKSLSTYQHVSIRARQSRRSTADLARWRVLRNFSTVDDEVVGLVMWLVHQFRVRRPKRVPTLYEELNFLTFP